MYQVLNLLDDAQSRNQELTIKPDPGCLTFIYIIFGTMWIRSVEFSILWDEPCVPE